MKTAKTKYWLGIVLAVLLIAVICPMIVSASSAPSDSIDFTGAQLRLDKAGIRFVGEFDVDTYTANANGLTVEYGFLVLPTVAITNYGQTLTYENTNTLKIATTNADQLLSAGDERLNGIAPATEGNKILLAVMRDMPESVFKSKTSFSALPYVAYLDGTTPDQVFYGTTKEYNAVDIANKAVDPETTQEPLANRVKIVKAFEGTEGFYYIIKDGEIVRDCEKYGHDYNTENICKWCGYEIVGTEGLQYTLLVNNEWLVSGYSGTATDVVIPAYYQDKPVTSVGFRAFYNCSSLESINIPSSVTTIGAYAFRSCSSLESITIPSSVTAIGDWAFWDCSNLKNIAFEAESKCTIIGESAFDGCSSLESITIPSSVTTIGSSAFYDCSSLKSVTFEVGSKCTAIGVFAFFDCSSLEYHTYDNAYYLGNSENPYMVLMEANSTDITSCTVHPNTKIICQCAFSFCDSLESIIVEEGNPVYHSAGNCIIETASKTLIAGCKNSVIPTDGSVTAIGDWAFCGCSNLQSITIPSSVTAIGEFAFCDCSNLQSITIPSSVTTIGSRAFEYCSSLQSITIPSSVTTIGSRAFEYCSSLQSITIPSSVTTIGACAFYNCSNLKIVTFEVGSQCTSIDKDAFEGCSSLQYSVYDNAYYLGNSENPYMVLVKASNTEITSCIVHPNTMMVCKEAFGGCSSLESITLPFVGASKEGTTDTHFGYIFGAYSGYNNDSYVPASLKTVVITGGVTIDSYAFYDCSSLEGITILSGVTSIGEWAFYDCSNLKSVSFEEGSQCTTIGNYAFWHCSSLESITIPASITTIGNYAFYNCSSLQSIIFEDTDTWYRTTDRSYTNGTQTDVTNSAQNATYFKDTYFYYYWYKE